MSKLLFLKDKYPKTLLIPEGFKGLFSVQFTLGHCRLIHNRISDDPDANFSET